MRMPTLASALILLARARRRLGLGPGPLPPYRDVFAPYVRGRSFADVGAMWSVHGRVAFEAEEEGATRVTAFDGMSPTTEFERERERRSSSVRFVRGDVNDPAALERIGRHDVVWCSGLLYHSPDPHLTVRHLCELTGEYLLLASATLPELPGLRGACVFYPSLRERDRRIYARVFPSSVALATPFDREQWYGNWWWGISPSALRSMVLTQGGFELVEEVRGAFDTILVARRQGRRPT